MWEKNKGTTKCDKIKVTCDIGTIQCEDETVVCDKSTVTYDVGTTQCEDETVKCEKQQKGKPLNVTKVVSKVMLELHNVRMKSSNVRKIKELPNVIK